MHLNSLRTPVLASLSFCTFVAASSCQEKPAAPATPPVPDAAAEGLPAFLLYVPGGQVQVGLTADQLIDAACQVVNPAKPEMAVKISESKVTEALRRSLSVLGQKKVDVEPFFLAKWPVKNVEYETYLKHRRAGGAKMRPPFHWWRYGAADSYNEKLGEINKAFPGQKEGPILFWERHGDEFPYALKDAKGNAIDDLPVGFVTWREANEFAGWLGMRLPTEAEWTRAARGDGTAPWPGQPGSAYNDNTLKLLQIYNSKEQVLKTSGAVQGATGPYGHVDMFGQIWQMIGDLGFRPILGNDVWAEQWKKMQKDKVGALVKGASTWKEDRAIAKGGSYLSYQEPIQLLIDARAPVQTSDVLESLGFRLAKSLRPGFDMLLSLLRGGYNKNLFLIDQQPDLGAQVGAERYELGPNGFPTAYHAVSFAPVNWLSNEKNPELGKLLEKSQHPPLLVGTLAVSTGLVEPALPSGIYSLLYRHRGVPKELVDAVKTGHKELLAAQKAAKDDKKAEDKKDDDKKADDGKKKKAGNWRDIVARFGLTDEDVLSKDAADGTLKFVRIDGTQIPIEDDCYLFYGGEGKVLGVLPMKGMPPVAVPAAAQSIEVTATDKGKALAKLRFTAPVMPGAKKWGEFHLHLQLDLPAPAADKPWRSTK